MTKGQLDGGCLCGQIRYTCTSEPALTAVCHCRNCQKQSGSTFSLLVAVPKGTIQVEGGDGLCTFSDRGESGQAVLRRFCGNCGSPLFSDVAAMPELEFIKAGTLDDASWLQPQAQFWCVSAQPWLQLSETLQRHERNPGP